MATINQNNGAATPAGNQAPISQVNQRAQGGGGLLNAFLLIVLIGLAVFGTFLAFDKGNVLNHTTDLDKQISDLNKQVDQYKSQKVEISKNASDALDKIKAKEIIWSGVIKQVNQLLPHEANGESKVQVISYSGTESGRIALNMTTAPAGVPPYQIVSGLLSTFNNSVFFKNAYVPSISKGQTDGGQTTLSFVLNMEYQNPGTGTADVNLPITPVVENTVRVPRTETSTTTAKVPVTN